MTRYASNSVAHFGGGLLRDERH
jgi:hypothetical protein